MAQVILTIPDNLLSIYQRFQIENGQTWVEGYIVQKLKELEIRFFEQDAEKEWEKTHVNPKRRLL